MMDQDLRQVVERIVRDTEALLSRGEVSWPVARRGVIMVIGDLCRKYPQCEAQIKEAFDPLIVRHDQEDRSRGGLAQWLDQTLESSVIVADKRVYERFAPALTDSVMRLTTGEEYPVTILNVSRSGVSLRTEVRPPFGSEVVVGGTRTIVVRHFADGIGGRFCELLGADTQRDKIQL